MVSFLQKKEKKKKTLVGTVDKLCNQCKPKQCVPPVTPTTAASQLSSISEETPKLVYITGQKLKPNKLQTNTMFSQKAVQPVKLYI